MKTKNKKITINDLAGMMQGGFTEITGKMGKLAKKSEMDAKFKGMDAQFAAVNLRLSEHDKRFDDLEEKIDENRNLMDSYVKAQEDFKEEFEVVKSKVGKIDKIEEAIDELGVEIK